MLLHIQRIPWTTLFWTSWVQFCVEFLIDANYRPCCSSGKEFPCNGRDLGWVPEWGRSAGGGQGYPIQYSGLENFMDCIGVTKSQTQLSNFHFSQYYTIVAGWICSCGIINTEGWLNFKQTLTAGLGLDQGPQTSHYSNVYYNSYANKVDVKTPEGKLHALFISCIEPTNTITFFPVTSEELKYRVWSHYVSISTLVPRKH